MPASIIERSLDEEVERYFGINYMIRRASSRETPDSEALSKLKERKKDLLRDIHTRMIHGERLDDSVQDYCFRNLVGKPCAVGLLRKFMEHVKSMRNQQILTFLGGYPREKGIISGECEFEINDSFRYLYVPVKQFLSFSVDRRVWQKKRNAGSKVYIFPDLFTHPEEAHRSDRESAPIWWVTGHSQLTYVGGSAPKETKVYLGKEYF